jgi:hypothetical protein
LVIERPRKGSRDIFRSYKILVDGALIGKLERGQRLVREVAAGRHVVRGVIDWAGSPEVAIDVADGGEAHMIISPGGNAFQYLWQTGKTRYLRLTLA